MIVRKRKRLLLLWRLAEIVVMLFLFLLLLIMLMLILLLLLLLLLRMMKRKLLVRWMIKRIKRIKRIMREQMLLKEIRNFGGRGININIVPMLLLVMREESIGRVAAVFEWMVGMMVMVMIMDPHGLDRRIQI